jgi:hypothetical protein
LAAALRFADEERELEDERLRALDDERLLLAVERLDPLELFLPPELPLLPRSAICPPPGSPRTSDLTLPLKRDYLTSKLAMTGP